MTMTPIGGGDLTWLKKLTEMNPPRVQDIHAPLSVENTTPINLDGSPLEPLLLQEDVDRIADTYLSIDKSARLLNFLEKTIFLTHHVQKGPINFP